MTKGCIDLKRNGAFIGIWYALTVFIKLCLHVHITIYLPAVGPEEGNVVQSLCPFLLSKVSFELNADIHVPWRIVPNDFGDVP